MKAVCIRACTIPVRGLVEPGVTVDVQDVNATWIKHFRLIGGVPVKQAEEIAPVVAPVAVAEKRGRGGRRKG